MLKKPKTDPKIARFWVLGKIPEGQNHYTTSEIHT